MFDKTGTLTCRSRASPMPPRSIPTCCERRRGWRCRAGIRWRRRWRARRASARRIDGAIEEPGQGVRAIIDGGEARLGSAAFCGMADPRRQRPADEAGTSLIAFAHARPSAPCSPIRQKLRPDAVGWCGACARSGLTCTSCPAIAPTAVAPVAAALGIADWQGGLKPADKIAAIEALKAQGRRVLMVGDGLNDAPALAAAHVSLSPISAADVTQAQADAVFLGERLAPVVDAVAIARRARALMQQNLWLAVVYNAVAVPIAIAGLVTPLIAAVAMSGSSMLVTLNALRACGESTRPRSAAMNVLVYLCRWRSASG